ncbi:lasso peptide biosynthesis B2 protein [Sphingomonas sp. BIUV-7]|uniref:Lasso peptide biosynthesis B2 protein n=1 Tax=Sphingomonas natans TaxID=3063330 RepID=A0ABT8YAR6_9SPHN|nr:lasso peptide biosynthesis B2 protein [Sphingomonas sp. BIUV-7]MDO6415428.1 lasso peptide biosynthesis B2 protein [Sphingomonas sp. BIUV-7]
MAYTLRDGLHFARTGGRTIFLDAPCNRYFCLSTTAAEAFDAFLAGAFVEEGSVLLRSGVLVPDRFGFSCEPAPKIARESLLDHSESDRSRPVDTSCLLYEFAVARARITLAPGRALRAMVRDRILRMPNGEPGGDPQRAAQAYLRAIRVGASHDQCFAWGLALLRFCRKRSIPVTCIIGVSARPFRAHCWVQSRDHLINDRYDHVRNFEPILSL